MSDNHYDVLGTDPDASRDELREAYRARVDELTAARDRKGITESQLQENREEVARVRSAWSVLSDPFQRQRYDSEVVDAGQRADGGEVEIVDDDRAEVELTGWRKMMAPPPRKPAAGAGDGARTTPTGRPVREPTIELPAGMKLAESRARGMALLFDLAVALLIMTAVQFVVPPLFQSDYKDTVSQIQAVDDAVAAQEDVDDATSAVSDADEAVSQAESNGTNQELKDAQADGRSARADLRSAQKDFRAAQQDYNAQQRDLGEEPSQLPRDVDKLQTLSDDLAEDIRGTQYLTALVTLVFVMLYLVPITARTGSTFGMRSRKIKVVRVDGSPVGWYPAFARFVIPVLIALAIPTIGPIAGLGLVLWGYRDPNGQGVHDKLARTLVVEA